MIVNKQCEACGVGFQYDEKPGYPRKYCPNCSAKKKAEYEAKKTQKVQPQPSNAVIGTTQGISEVKHVFQNAYEFGKAGYRHKIYYEDIDELKNHVEALRNAGLVDEDIQAVSMVEL